jgi:Ni,Fe-hydrogenase I large subunit
METLLIARRLQHWYDLLIGRIRGGDVATFTKDRWEPSTWPAKAQGYGDLEAPRGRSGTGCRSRTAASPATSASCRAPGSLAARARREPGHLRDRARGRTTRWSNPEQPLEILRTVHSFDPCMACGVHVLDARGRPLVEVRAQ